MRSHFIHDLEADTYFRTVYDNCSRIVEPGNDGAQHIPIGKDRSEADLYEQEDACAIAQRFYGPDGHTQGKWEIIEATPQERHLWVSRRGGRTRTAAQARARKRNGERHGGRYRICKACGGRVERTQPANVHLCEKCQNPIP